MGRNDWHENRDWTPAIQDLFEAKLRRARDKAQPLVRQANALIAAGGRERVAVAEALLQRYFTIAPANNLFFAPAFVAQAKCHLVFDRRAEAIDALRQAVRAERQIPGIQVGAWWMFARCVVECRRPDLFDEALGVLDEFQPANHLLPFYRYEAAVVRAWIASERGQRSEARQHATAAMAAASIKQSGFRRHPLVGLVGDRTADPLWPRVELLAAGTGGLPSNAEF